MIKICEFDVWIAVDYKGEGYLLSQPVIRTSSGFEICPECIKFGLDIMWDGPFCEDNTFYHVPKIAGVYRCRTEFWFSQGYAEGYPAGGESDWEFKIVEAIEIASVPTPIIFDLKNEIGGDSNEMS